MTLILGSVQLGFLYGILTLGIYISFRVLNIPDLTTEGSFTLGLAAAAAMTAAGHPLIGILLSVLAGAAAGAVTGLLQTKLMIHPVLAGILTMSGLYSVNLFILGSSNLTLIGVDTAFSLIGDITGLPDDIVDTAVPVLLTVICTGGMIWFFKTHAGMCIRATGDNADMVRASSINVHGTVILGLCVSNGLIALSGGLIAQYQKFADISSGMGILVVGLASVIIGEAIFGKRGVTVGFVSAVFGSIIYRFIIAWATKSSFFPASMLKLVSAVIVAAALSLPAIRHYISVSKIKKEAKKNAEN